jgi:ELWxxDGT repeat protein
VWSSDGTGSGTRLARDLCLGHCSTHPGNLSALLGQAFFLAEGLGDEEIELWRTDGTEKGTQRLATLGQYAFTPYSIHFAPVALRDRVLFAARDLSSNGQLWASDGTPEGTGPVTAIRGGGLGSEPRGFASDGNAAWFNAHDGTDLHLWRSAGTAATTTKTPGRREQFVLARGLAFYVSGDGGLFDALWRTDGTPGGTRILTPPGTGYAVGLALFGDKAAVVFQTPGAGLSLWESNGTPAGTRKLVDLPPLGSPIEVAAAGPELFVAGPGSVWRTDGTMAGTREVPMEGLGLHASTFVSTLARMGARIFFVSHSPLDGPRVWRIEGATGSPQPLLPLGTPAGRFPSSPWVFQGALYFFAHTADSGIGLWKSDGTTAGTVLLRVFPEVSFAPGQVDTAALGNRLYFAFDDAVSGNELWRTDGTPEGTVLVRDVVPGPGSSFPSGLAAAGDRLFFAAADDEHGIELWESDGTEAGTRMVHDVAPGAPSSQPADLTVAGGRLFFSADDGVHGREPWVLPLGGSGCQPSQEVLCLGGRFRVEAFWRDFQGNFGPGKAVALTADTGYFWFFDSSNVEVILKVLDGQGVNGHHWVFYGALSTVEYTLTVTDTQTGAARRYVNPPGRLGSVGDTIAFGPLGAIGSKLSTGPAAVEWEPLTAEVRMTAAAPCAESATRLCLQGGRFAVEAAWRDFQGNTGAGQAVPLAGGETGYFWFFNPDNVEVVLKVLDGRPVNDKFWVFYGALSSVEYTLTVTDTQTGKTRKYGNPSGRLASVADTGAF